MNFIKKVNFTEEILENISELIENNKLVLIENVPDSFSNDAFYIKLGNTVGYLIHKSYNQLTKKIDDNAWDHIEFNEVHVEKAYKFSNKRHFLHTDFCDMVIPFDCVLLICKQPAEIGGETTFLDSEYLIELLEKYAPELYKKLLTTDVIFSNKPQPIFKNINKIISFDEKGPLLNWSYNIISKENSKEVFEVTNEFHEFLNTFVFNAAIPTAIKLKKNDIVLMNDHRLLHGRNSYFGYRHLLKSAISITHQEEIKEMITSLNLSV